MKFCTYSRALCILAGFLFLMLCFAVPGFSYGDNSPEEEQSFAEDEYLRKINFACGAQISITYDAKSLVEHNVDIRRTQTGGGLQCNEPLRYIWYLCQADRGKSAVQDARLEKIVCKGTAANTGSLKREGGSIIVERAFGEDKSYLRSRKQFEAIFETKLKLENDDPYYDEKWRKLKLEPNPVTDTKTYCVVNGKKTEWERYQQGAADPFVRRKEDATVKCWKDGELITSLAIKKGLKTGFETYIGDNFIRRNNYLNGKKDGEQKQTEYGRNGKLEKTIITIGKEKWVTEYYPDGKLKQYSRTYLKGIDRIHIGEDGKLYGLHCSPQSRDDKVLHKWCGFEGEATHSIYDGTKKLSKTVTYKDGVLLHEGAGNSNYSPGSDVSFKNGKKHGEERIVDKNGKLEKTITWNQGIKDGKELKYADDGKRVVTETIWKGGKPQQITEFYLNGNPKQIAVGFESQRLQVRQFWDNGKVSEEGILIPCKSRDRWCEEGVHKKYYEGGERESEITWKNGKKHGAAKIWWKNGRLKENLEYDQEKLTKRQTWDRDGNLTLDEEYESDGSRKLRR